MKRISGRQGYKYSFMSETGSRKSENNRYSPTQRRLYSMRQIWVVPRTSGQVRHPKVEVPDIVYSNIRKQKIRVENTSQLSGDTGQIRSIRGAYQALGANKAM